MYQRKYRFRLSGDSEANASESPNNLEETNINMSVTNYVSVKDSTKRYHLKCIFSLSGLFKRPTDISVQLTINGVNYAEE